MEFQVRPTLRALKLLPPESYDSTAILGTLDRARATTDPEERRMILNGLTLAGLSHPLLDDARRAFATGAPDRHRESSAAAHRPVYEARSTTGAAWRGSVIRDGDTAWLVFACAHDRYHSTAATYIKKGAWEPTALDHELRDADNRAAALAAWKTALFTDILQHLTAAATTPGPHAFTTPPDVQGCTWDLTFTVEHDHPAQTAAQAHTTSGLVQITARATQDAWPLLTHAIPLLDALQSSEHPLETTYLSGGDILLLLTVTHAALAQVSADIAAPTSGQAPTLMPSPPTHLHWVNTPHLTQAFVLGTVTEGLCGTWFVPLLDGAADLPVCPACEQAKPLAQAILDALRT